MSTPITIVAGAAAQRLEAEAGPGLTIEVEAGTGTRESPSMLQQYVQPVTGQPALSHTSGPADRWYT